MIKDSVFVGLQNTYLCLSRVVDFFYIILIHYNKQITEVSIEKIRSSIEPCQVPDSFWCVLNFCVNLALYLRKILLY